MIRLGVAVRILGKAGLRARDGRRAEHAPQAMFGKVVVEPAGAGGAPASLPNTGAGSATPILPLLGGALLLLLGILLRGVWRRQADTNI